MEKLRIQHEEYNQNFKGFIGDEEICSLELYQDEEDGRYWLNGIYTHKEENQHKGYATLLMNAAIEYYGEIYVSTASDMERKERGDVTARELTIEGAALVNKLKEKGILKSEWFVNPFGSDFGYEDEN